jgi:FtsH-binding integral membrane protein
MAASTQFDFGTITIAKQNGKYAGFLILYVIISKTNCTYCGAFLFCFLGISLFFMLFGFIFGKWGNIIFCALGVFIYSFYLLYDTQLIFKRFGIGYSIDDYIIAALNLYIDFIEILLNILNLMPNK